MNDTNKLAYYVKVNVQNELKLREQLLFSLLTASSFLLELRQRPLREQDLPMLMICIAFLIICTIITLYVRK